MGIYLNVPEKGQDGHGYVINVDYYDGYYGVRCKPVVYYKEGVVSHFAGTYVVFAKTKRSDKRTIAKYMSVLDKNKKEFDVLTGENCESIAYKAVSVLKKEGVLK